MRYCLVLAPLLSACLADFGDSSSSVEGQDVVSEGCKIEGSQIGKQGVVLTHKSRAIRFKDWVPKSGSSGEYVGFSLELTGSSTVKYRVKASGEVHPAQALSWLHPYGPSGGTKSPGISNVEICDCDCYCEGYDDDGGGDGGGGGGDGPIL